MLQIYCGNGKGKTTAALGLAMRAAGSGMRVYLMQFLKGGDTSELEVLARLPEITVRRCERNYGFTFCMTEEEKQALRECHNAMLAEAAEVLRSKAAELVVLDEFFGAWNAEVFDRRAAERLVSECPADVELVLTGREPDERFLKAADYVSDIHAVKHPYTKGVTARKGIEY